MGDEDQGKMFTPKEYPSRPGGNDFGRDYEFKMAAFLFLRAIGQKGTKHAWLAMNVDKCGAFDDVILYRKTNDDAIVYLIQLKHSEKSPDIRADEFKTKKTGPFYLKKYFNDIGEIRANEDFDLFFNRASKVFVLFTNRGTTEGCDFLKKVVKKSYLDFRWFLYETIDTSYNIESIFQFDYRKLNETFEEEDFFLFTKQMHVENLDFAIANAVKSFIQPVKVSQEVLNDIALKFVCFLTEWSKGQLGGYYPMTKTIVIKKLVEILLEPYRFVINNQKKEKKCCSFWNEIVIDKNLVVINNTDGSVVEFIEEFLDTQINDYQLNGEFKKSLKEDSLNRIMLRITTIGNKKIAYEDLYEILWKTGKLPLVLKNNAFRKKQMQNILKLSQGLFKFIVLNQEETSLQMPNSFTKMKDLKPEQRANLTNIHVKLQGRNSSLTLKTVNNSNLTVKDIIYILSDKFNVGGWMEPLPEYYVEINLKRVWLDFPVLSEVKDNFLIKCSSELSFKIFMKKFNIKLEYTLWKNVTSKDNCRIIIFVEEPENSSIKKIENTHFLVLHDMDALEWINSTCPLDNLKMFRKTHGHSIRPVRELLLAFEETTKRTILISANPGMGKTVLLNYIALNAPSSLWILKINLPEHKDFFKTYETGGTFLNFLKTKSSLDQGIFQSHLKTKRVLFLLDAFDEVPVSCQNGAKKFLNFIYSSGLPFVVATRPFMKTELERLLNTFAIDLCLFTRTHQECYLVNYFNDVKKQERQDLTKAFAKNLLDSSKQNLNDLDNEFTGIPLQTILLAEVFEEDYLKYLEEERFFTKQFDLLYLYEHFVEKKIRIACRKIESTSEDMIGQYKICRTLYALQLLFCNDLEGMEIGQKLEAATVLFPNIVQLIQKDGVVVAEDERNVTFVHYTFAEYLVAVWLAENIGNNEHGMVELLIKRSFQPRFRTMRNIFDRIVCKSFPLHLAIINYQVDLVKELIVRDDAIFQQTDRCGRNFFHMIASWGLHHPVVNYNEFPTAKILKKMAKEHAMMEIFNLIPVEKLIVVKDVVLGYNPWDYAFISGSLNIADAICLKLKKIEPNISADMIDHHYFCFYCPVLCYTSLTFFILAHFSNNASFRHSYKKYQTLLDDQDFTSRLTNQIPTVNYGAVLIWATCFGKLDAIKFLLLEGADVNYKHKGMTSLHWAAQWGLLEEMKLLLTHRADLDVHDKEGMAALHLATRSGILESVDLLLLNGANSNDISSNGMTALHWASIFGYLDTAKLLVSRKTKLETKTKCGRTALHYAAITERADVVDYLLSEGANFQARDNDDMTPLHFAALGRSTPGIQNLFTFHTDCNSTQLTGASHGYKIIINLLLSKGANIQAENDKKMTPLHVAAYGGQKEIVKFLLGKGAELEAEDDRKQTPLDCAAYKGNVDVIELLMLNQANAQGALVCAAYNDRKDALRVLLANGKKLDEEDYRNVTLLSWAAHQGCTDTAQQLLLEGADANATSEDDLTPLHLAAHQGHVAMVDLLLTHGANIEAKTRRDHATCLQIAIQDNHIPVVNLLISRGAKVENPPGFSIMTWAITNRHKDTLHLLLDNGGNIEEVYDGFSLLNRAAYFNLVEITELLLSKGANIEATTVNNYTPLHLAAQNGHVKMAQLLINHHANIEAKGDKNTTPLHLAIQCGHIEVVTVLLENRANMEEKFMGEQTGLHIAAKYGHANIATLLLAHGANLNGVFDGNITPLHCAVGCNNIDVVMLFLSRNANPERATDEDITPLELARQYEFTELVDLLTIHMELRKSEQGMIWLNL